MNDVKEQLHAVEVAQNNLMNRVRRTSPGEVQDVLTSMGANAMAANRQVYTVSLSRKEDSTAQWQAYCPPTGGYAIGFPTWQLLRVAQEQGFYLAQCEYHHIGQYEIVDGIIAHHLDCYQVSRAGGELEAVAKAQAVTGFADDLARFGPILKHHSFAHEEEWRLVSEPKQITDPNLGFRSGPRSVVPYYKFRLTTPAQPSLTTPGGPSFGVRVGPTLDSASAQLAVQALLLRTVGEGCWHGPSDSSYRGI